MMSTKALLRAAGAACVLGVMATGGGGCLNRPIDRIDPRTTSTVVELLKQDAVNKIDLLLDIDNSLSMKDKQQILSEAVPDLVSRLVTPNCVDENDEPTGSVVDSKGKCPAGSRPEFAPIRDINIGVISSSLGDLTSGACKSDKLPNRDDRGHLLTRVQSGPAPNDYDGKGFLAWDPDQQRKGQDDVDALNQDLTAMVRGVDQVGCAFEMPLEAAVRFLVDPSPYDHVESDGASKPHLNRVGVDKTILQQRKDFLRPDSLVALIILSDENDCSLDIDKQGFVLLGKTPFYRSTSECADDPNDACCSSCNAIGAGCDKGGACTGPNGAKLTTDEDRLDLKCFHQKQRFGVDFLYPTTRYVNAFSAEKIDPSKSDLAGGEVDNPLFYNAESGLRRATDLVFVAGIVGVPWQAIADDSTGQPDLKKGFKSFKDLEPDLDYLIGDPDNHVEPKDPFMIESTSPRSGTSKLTQESLPGSNAINGHDFASTSNLEHVCTFPLDPPVTSGGDCTDCTTAECDNPLCDGTTQIAAKAYPGLRELAVLRGLKDQGIFASICPASTDKSKDPEIYGYAPAVRTIIERLKEKLKNPCLPRSLTEDEETGGVDCLVLEASATGGRCTCGEGRSEIPEREGDHENPAYNAVKLATQSDFRDEDWDCFCEIKQLLEQPQRDACLNDKDPTSEAQGDGWCYVDANPAHVVGDPELVRKCPEDEQRIIRFVGAGEPRIGSTVIITCTGE